MSRSKVHYSEYYGRQCPYQKACPHLQGMNVELVWSRYQTLSQTNRELTEQLDEARKRIRELDEKVAQLQVSHRRQFKTNKASPDPKSRTGKEKKRGAPKGHPPWTRTKPKEADREIHVERPHQCPHCQCGNLKAHPENHAHWQEDIQLVPRTLTIRYSHDQSWCPQCRRPVFQTAPTEMRNAPIGPVAKALNAYFRYRIGMSYRKSVRILEELYGLKVAPASACGFDTQIVSRAKDLYHDLHAKIKASEVLHADETQWRVDGTTHQLWYAGNEHLAYFHVDRHRNAEAAQRVIGPEFEGLLIADDYASYNILSYQDRQSCLAHLQRKAKELQAQVDLAREPRKPEASLKKFLSRFIQWVSDVCHRSKTLEANSPKALTEKTRWLKQLDEICGLKFTHSEAQTFKERLIGNRERVLAFLHYPEAKPTNNQAEQSLRNHVIHRKTIFGNRSEGGARNHGVLCSIIQTALRQGNEPREILELLLTDRAQEAKAGLYSDSS